MGLYGNFALWDIVPIYFTLLSLRFIYFYLSSATTAAVGISGTYRRFQGVNGHNLDWQGIGPPSFNIPI